MATQSLAATITDADGKRLTPRYVAVFRPVTVDEAHWPKDTPPGLLLAHRVKHAGAADTVVGYWASEDDFRRDGDAWSRALGCNELVQAGLVGQLRTKPAPWFKSIKLHTWILSAAALLGALEVISNRYATLFEAPSLVVRPHVGATSTIEFVEGDEIAVKADLVSQLTIAHTNIDTRAALRRRTPASPPAGGDTLAMAMSEPKIARLAAGEKHEVAATLTASAPGEWEAEIAATARAGALRAGGGPFTATTRVKVWPKLDAPAAQWQAYSGTRGALKGWIDAGARAPAGVRCRIEITRVAGLDQAAFDVGTKTTAAEWLPSAEKPGQEFYKQSWTTGPLDGKQRIPYELYVDAPVQTDWAAVTRSTRIRCVPNR